MKDIPVKKMTRDRLEAEYASALNCIALLQAMSKQACKWTPTDDGFYEHGEHKTACGHYVLVTNKPYCADCGRKVEVVK